MALAGSPFSYVFYLFVCCFKVLGKAVSLLARGVAGARGKGKARG